MYETWDRPKAIMDGRHMLEVKHKIDSEYQATLRRKELEREQSERKREEQMSKQQRRLLSLTSIYSNRSYERPWVNGMASKKQTSVSDAWWNCNSKPLVKTHAAKLPAILSRTDQKKYASVSVLKNVSVNFDTTNPASQPEILTKRTRLHERALPRRAVITTRGDPQDVANQTSTHQQKTAGRDAEDISNGRQEANDKKRVHGSKSSIHITQYKRDMKIPEGVLRYKSRALRPCSPPNTISPSASSQKPHVSSVTENSESSPAPLNSSRADGHSSNHLNRSSSPSPGSTVPSSASLNRHSRSSLTPPILPRATGFTSNQLSWPTNAPATVSENSGSLVSVLNRPSHVCPSSSDTYDSIETKQKVSYDSLPSPLDTSISLKSQMTVPSHSPTISERDNASLLRQLYRPSHASTSAPSNPSSFKFQEEGFYDSLNTVVENEDTTDDHMTFTEDFLPTAVCATASDLNENGNLGQTSFVKVTPTESWSDMGDSESTSLVSSTQLDMENNTSIAPYSGENAPVSPQGEHLGHSSSFASVENSPLGNTSILPINRIDFSEFIAARKMQDHQNNTDCISEGTTRAAEVMPSSSISSRSLTLSSQGQEDLVTLNTDTSCLEVPNINGSPRFNESRRTLSSTRNRISFSTWNHEPILNESIAVEPDRRQLGRCAARQSNSHSPTAVVQRDSEESVQNTVTSSVGASSAHSVLRNLSQGHSVGSSLQESLPLALLAMSDLHPHAGLLDQRLLLQQAAMKETIRPKADPEKLRRLKESLMEEDSEEEGDVCRICLIPGGTVDNPLLEPCHCGGSLQFVHKECLVRWLKSKITSGIELEAVRTCELCRQRLQCDLGDFSLEDFYNTQQQSQGQSDLMNSGLYLMLLLHLYEQRYAELLRLTHSRARRDMIFRNYQVLRTEANTSVESADDEEGGEHRSPSRIA